MSDTEVKPHKVRHDGKRPMPVTVLSGFLVSVFADILTSSLLKDLREVERPHYFVTFSNRLTMA